MKTGFILHLDSLSVLDELSNEQAGILFKALRDYNLGKEPELDFAMRMAFLPFKNQFERDNEKYIKVVERNQQNGSKGGRPKKPKETEKTQSVILEPKKADNKNDNNNKKENNKINIEERKINFAESLRPYLEIYGRDMLNEFFAYWTEQTQTKNPKLKFELQNTWSVSRRLATWKQQDDKFNPKQQTKFKAPWE